MFFLQLDNSQNRDPTAGVKAGGSWPWPSCVRGLVVRCLIGRQDIQPCPTWFYSKKQCLLCPQAWPFLCRVCLVERDGVLWIPYKILLGWKRSELLYFCLEREQRTSNEESGVTYPDRERLTAHLPYCALVIILKCFTVLCRQSHCTNLQRVA